MSLTHITDLTFRNIVSQWIDQNHEILVMIRYSHMAGAKSFEFFTKYHAAMQRILHLPARTSVVIFRDPQLPLRGKVDDKFIRAAKSLLKDGEEFLVVGTEPEVLEKCRWFPEASGETHEELEIALRDMTGKSVAVGKYPPWLVDSDAVASAVMQNDDGLELVRAY